MPENTSVAPSQPAPQAQTADAGKTGPANVTAAQFSQFLNRAPETPAPTETAPAAPEATTAETQVSSAEPTPPPETPSPEAAAVPEEAETEALSHTTSLTPEQQAAIDKRIGKITAKRKEAEREAEALRLEVLRLRQSQPAQPQEAPSPSPVASSDPLGSVTTVAGLQKLHTDAKEAVRWAEEQLDREDIANGIQVADGKILTKTDLKAIVRNAKVTLEDHIPARYQFLQQQQQATQQAFEIYPELKDPATPEYQMAQMAYQQNPWLRNLPNSAIIIGRMIQGVKLEQERIKAKTNPAPAPKPAIRPKPSSDQTAVSSGGSSSRLPASSRNLQQIQQEVAKLSAKGGSSAKDYAAFLSKTEQLRNQS